MSAMKEAAEDAVEAAAEAIGPHNIVMVGWEDNGPTIQCKCGEVVPGSRHMGDEHIAFALHLARVLAEAGLLAVRGG